MTEWDAFNKILICDTRRMSSPSMQIIRTDGVKVVDHLAEISTQGRDVYNDQMLFLLAMAITYGDKDTALLGLNSIRKVVRTGSHLLQFVSFIDGMRGWGTGLRRAIQRWYQHHPIDQLTFQMLRYKQRDGWTQRDVLRKVHPRPNDTSLQSLFWFICHHLVPWDKFDPGPGDHDVMEFKGFVVPINSPDRILDYVRLHAEKDSTKIDRIISRSDWLSHDLLMKE